MKWQCGALEVEYYLTTSNVPPLCVWGSLKLNALYKSCAVTLQGSNGILLLKVPEKPPYPHLLIQQQHLFLRQSRLQGLLPPAVPWCCREPRFFPSHHSASLRIGSVPNLFMSMATRWVPVTTVAMCFPVQERERAAFSYHQDNL